MTFNAKIHEEDGSYWAEVEELPGCFASGATLDELREALIEAISLYLTETAPAGAKPSKSKSPPTGQVDGLRMLIPA